MRSGLIATCSPVCGKNIYFLGRIRPSYKSKFGETITGLASIELNSKTTETTSQVFSNKNKEIAAFKRIAAPSIYVSTLRGDSSNQKGTERESARRAGMTNEYFIPKDGIDREVITADICRYLGNDALVRQGAYEVHI
jgi:hypothetical protein